MPGDRHDGVPGNDPQRGADLLRRIGGRDRGDPAQPRISAFLRGVARVVVELEAMTWADGSGKIPVTRRTLTPTATRRVPGPVRRERGSFSDLRPGYSPPAPRARGEGAGDEGCFGDA